MKYWVWMLCLFSSITMAVEHKVSGIVDVRASYTDGITSYVDAGLGKFRFNPDGQVSLAQGGLSYQIDWENPLSAHVVANAYWDGVRDNIGLTEAYLKYKGLPWSNGLRLSVKLGILYPDISMENIATAWSSPYTLTYSNINSWIGEEVRHIGGQFSLEHLGKFSDSSHDFKLVAELFQNNDTTGAMLSWHGWTNSSRQTLWQEKLPLSALPSLDGGSLTDQAKESDPFLELDDHLGYHVKAQWRLQSLGRVELGYYDNDVDTSVVKEGQYTWLTQFGHIGTKWRLPYHIELIAQYIKGDTSMHSPSGSKVVDNGYESGFILLSHRWQRHRVSFRFEHFNVTDNDLTLDDDNREQGKAVTLSYGYQLRKGWFLQAEYNRIDSTRPARQAQGYDKDLIEEQWQLASRYYF
ncbi:hypothetical protein HWQ46_03975 [Shewanella sp. D64]|uniref:hypothetical protein n=1 Tax=unclassified Shewanella TaxID=196818 RepID=UPI0022BA15C3|nr:MULTISPECIES: hypothetical protein [unclassified Shewanella]MEC4724704.1 hypothetical protein [Shewanella sp. D64]MEC4736502.1 hypothetical protein [Shewanella sp. E94]WBJ97444.1 hypothetical protein HWQ47_10350 [Shewanella sp. MTB7]